MNYERIILVNFGQYAGTTLYFELIQQLKRKKMTVLLITDHLSAKRLGCEYNADVLTCKFCYSSIRNLIFNNCDENTFILFGNIVFAIPCVDLLIEKSVDYSIQSTVFFRKLYKEALERNQGDSQTALITLFNEYIVPGYKALYSINENYCNKKFESRGAFWKQVGQTEAVIEYEDRVLRNCVNFYSYYNEPFKLDIMKTYYAEFANKISSLIPSISLQYNEDLDNILKTKIKNKKIIFFCGAREFYFWNGSFALEVFRKMPNDFSLTILGQVPQNALNNLGAEIRARIETGMINDREKLIMILKEASVLLGINRQFVSFSILEAIKEYVPCVLGSEIVSYNDTVLERTQTCGAVYVPEKRVDLYVKYMVDIVENFDNYKEHVLSQLNYVAEHCNIEKTAKQFIKDIEKR